MKVGMSTSCYFTKVNTEDTLPHIRALGVDRFEAFLGGLYEYKEDFAKDMAREQRDLGLACTAVHTLGSQFEPQLFASHPRQRQAALDMFEMALVCARHLNARYYVMHGSLFLKKKAFRPNYEAVGARFQSLCELAESYGVRLTLENVHWCQYHEAGFAAAIAPYLNGCSLGYTLDIKQAAQSGCPMEAYLAEMGDRLCNVHLCDVTQKGDAVTPSLPGRGAFDFAALAETLRQRGFDGAVTLEVYPDNWQNEAELGHAYEYLASLFA